MWGPWVSVMFQVEEIASDGLPDIERGVNGRPGSLFEDLQGFPDGCPDEGGALGIYECFGNGC